MIKFNKMYNIAGVKLQLLCDKDIKYDMRYQLFCDNSCKKADAVISFKAVDELIELPDRKLVKSAETNYNEYIYDGEYIRFFIENTNNTEYAYLYRKDIDLWECCYLNKYENLLNDTCVLFDMISLERIFIDRGIFMLHSSLVNYKGQGIVFSGPSGIGKSTQASLWQKYAGATVINGDKVLIRNENGKWYGYGSPFSGSSWIYKKERVEINNLIFLEQDNERCSASRIKGVMAFKKIYEQVVVNAWNREYVNKLFDILNSFISEIDVYHYKTTKNRESVEYLKDNITLYEG